MKQQYKAWTQKQNYREGVFEVWIFNQQKTLKIEQTEKVSDAVFCYFKKRYNHWTVTVKRKENTIFIITGKTEKR